MRLGELFDAAVAATTSTPSLPRPMKSSLTPALRSVQVMPSGELIRLPLSPTATQVVPLPAAAFRSPGVAGRARWVQVRPSGDVSMPAKPTATNSLPSQATSSRLTSAARSFQICVAASVEVLMALPTLTSSEPFQARPPSTRGPSARVVKAEAGGAGGAGGVGGEGGVGAGAGLLPPPPPPQPASGSAATAIHAACSMVRRASRSSSGDACKGSAPSAMTPPRSRSDAAACAGRGAESAMARLYTAAP